MKYTDLIFKMLTFVGLGLIGYFFLRLVLNLFGGQQQQTSPYATTGTATAFPALSSWFKGVPTPNPPQAVDNTAALINASGGAAGSFLTGLASLFKKNPVAATPAATPAPSVINYTPGWSINGSGDVWSNPFFFPAS